MSTLPHSEEAPEAASQPSPQYVVVARRYRPQAFDELVGQEHVAKALSNAISTKRVGHAYLFTGARGVGKTSAARILAKALNCQTGPTPTPCNHCDICERISAGEDVDVLEIDGASNRGIDEIRQLRQNVNVRPSRERFKIYIIDEVHMLTREAFNALLKTLEEPPEHVKFIFCTTEPGKIPVTILSRCQRFDFAGIETAAIAKRLEQIVRAEGLVARPEALKLLARRAAGSMRDSQSLLEQLLAFAPGEITVADVDAMLGTAGDDRLGRVIAGLMDGDAGNVLRELDAAINGGVDPSQFAEQLLGAYRDMMIAAAGCPQEMFLYASLEAGNEVSAAATRLGLENILAAMQILDQALSRLRYTTLARLVVELALVRIANLGDLRELSDLVAAISTGAVGGEPRAISPPEAMRPGSDFKKKPEPLTPLPTQRETPSYPSTASSPTPDARNEHGSSVAVPQGSTRPGSRVGQENGENTPAASGGACPVALTAENVTELWSRAATKIPGMAAEHARQFRRVAISAPNRLLVGFTPEYTFSKSMCEAPERKAQLERALSELVGHAVHVEFEILGGQAQPAAAEPNRSSPAQNRNQVAQNPMVRRAMELFGAFPERVE